MRKAKPILGLDFDGVIHSYTSGWQGAGRCDDEPVPGTLEYLMEATKHFRVMIYSSRSKSLAGRAAMRRYMREHFAVSLTFSPDHDHGGSRRRERRPSPRAAVQLLCPPPKSVRLRAYGGGE